MTPPTTRCESCGALVPEIDGPTHEYMTGAPGCWQRFTEVIAREFTSAAYGGVHQTSVDAYAVQHPGGRDRAARRSVALHLMSLCLTLERRAAPAYQARRMAAWATHDNDFEWLARPSSLGAITVADVHRAADPGAHVAAVGRWGESVWRAWSSHHDRVREWVDRLERHPTTAERARGTRRARVAG